MMDLYRVVCWVYGKGMQVLEIWDSTEAGAKEEAKFHFHSKDCVLSCELIASGYDAQWSAYADAAW